MSFERTPSYELSSPLLTGAGSAARPGDGSLGRSGITSAPSRIHMRLGNDIVRKRGLSVGELNRDELAEIALTDRARLLKARVFYLVVMGRAFSPLEKSMLGAMLFVLTTGTLSCMSETVEFTTSQSLDDMKTVVTDIIEVVVTFVITAEYVARLWSCVPLDKSLPSPPWKGRLRFAARPNSIVDLAVLLPWWFYAVSGGNVGIFGNAANDWGEQKSRTALYFLRIMRIVKLARYSNGLKTLLAVVQRKGSELLSSVILGAVLAVMVSTIVFVCEHHVPDTEYTNLVVSLWWGIITLTTVGYGDISPVTPCGRFFGSLSAFVGIGLFTLPGALIASGFMEVQEEFKEVARRTTETIFDMRRIAELRVAFRKLRIGAGIMRENTVAQLRDAAAAAGSASLTLGAADAGHKRRQSLSIRGRRKQASLELLHLFEGDVAGAVKQVLEDWSTSFASDGGDDAGPATPRFDDARAANSLRRKGRTAVGGPTTDGGGSGSGSAED